MTLRLATLGLEVANCWLVEFCRTYFRGVFEDIAVGNWCITDLHSKYRFAVCSSSWLETVLIPYGQSWRIWTNTSPASLSVNISLLLCYTWGEKIASSYHPLSLINGKGFSRRANNSNLYKHHKMLLFYVLLWFTPNFLIQLLQTICLSHPFQRQYIDSSSAPRHPRF